MVRELREASSLWMESFLQSTIWRMFLVRSSMPMILVTRNCCESWFLREINKIIIAFVNYFKLTHRSMITIHSVNGWSQVITGVEFNCLAAMKGAHHLLLLILSKPSGEWKSESTFGRVAGSDPAFVPIFCFSRQSATITLTLSRYYIAYCA